MSNNDIDYFVPNFNGIQEVTKGPLYQGRVGPDDYDGIDPAYFSGHIYVSTPVAAASRVTDGALEIDRADQYYRVRLLPRLVFECIERVALVDDGRTD